MPVSATLRAMPAGVQQGNLGQIVSLNNSILVSLLHAPLVFERPQQYLVFPGATHGPLVSSYYWTIQDGPTTTHETTSDGRLTYTPVNTGSLQVSVELRNDSGTALETLSLTQQVLPLLPELETLIDSEDTGPAAANPATSREILNDYRGYVDLLVPPASEPLLNKLILAIAYNKCMARSWLARNAEIQSLAGSLNSGGHASLYSSARNGIGICGIRPQLAAMILEKTAGNPYTVTTNMPLATRERPAATQTIETNFNALIEADKIDIFNILTIPRTALKACLDIVTKLRDTFFMGQSWADVLGDRTKGRQLITHFETGPWAAAPSVSAFARSTFTLISHPVWRINARALAAAAGGGGGSPAGTTPSAPAPIGSPEIIPETTFIATPSQADNGFIRTAEIYHETYGLNPVRVTSWEDIIDRLSTGTGSLNRIRVVSHFYFPPGSTTAESNMNMPFFNGGARHTLKNDFRFANSDEDGLLGFLETSYLISLTEGYFTNTIRVPYRNNPDGTTTDDVLWKVILMGIRNGTNASKLTPFALQINDPASPPLLKIVKCATDLFYLDKLTINLVDNVNLPTLTVIATTTIKNAFINRIGELITAQTAAVLTGSRTQTDLDQLVAAIRGIASTALPVSLNFNNVSTSLLISERTFLQNHNSFRTKLQTVRSRITASTHIDIRGCQVGRDPAYMAALDTFLTNGSISPVITAPEWYQSFTSLGFVTIPSVALIDSTFSSGGSGLSGADVQREFGNWSGRIGITSHLLFWQQVAVLDDFSFLDYSWNRNMPGLALTPVKLDGFSGLNFQDVVQRLAEIFDMAASIPANLATFETANRTHITSLKTELQTIAGYNASTPVPDLTARLTALQAIATALSQTLAAAPSPLTLAHLQTISTQLKQHLVTTSAISAFKTALLAKVNHANAGIRYMLMTGFPLAVQQASDENNIRLLLYDTVKDDALEIWMQMQFTGTRPAGSLIGTLTPLWSPPDLVIPNDPATNNDDDYTDLGKALQTAMLSNAHTATIVAINPTYEYADHIKTL